MKPENYLNVIKKLNTEIYETGIDTFEMDFDYISNYYVDIVKFIGIDVFNSEVDCEVETEEQLEELIREKISKITNVLLKLQKKNICIIGVDLAKNAEMSFNDNASENVEFTRQDLENRIKLLFGLKGKI